MLGLVFDISYAGIFYSNMMTSSFMSMVRNVPGVFTTATSLLLCASIADVISTDSNTTVEGVESFF